MWWPRDAVRPIHRRTRRPIVVAFIQEGHEVAVNEPYDVMLQATSDPRGFAQNIPTIFVPDAAQLMDEYVLHALPSDLIVRPGASAMRRARAALAMKTKAVAFMQAACWKDFYANEAIIRVALFDRIKIAFAARSRKERQCVRAMSMRSGSVAARKEQHVAQTMGTTTWATLGRSGS